MKPAFLILLATLGATAQDTQPGQCVNISQESQSTLGASLAAQIQRTTTPIDNAAVRDYVERIGRRLAAQLPEDPSAYTFAVIAGQGNNTTHESLALPGGYVFVPAGLILAAQDEAEFAGMLAHSIAHVSEQQFRCGTLGTIPVIFMGGWTGYGAAQSLLLPAAGLKSQRGFEMDADRLAIKLTSSAGFDPAALVRYIGRVQQPDARSPKVFATLPTREERVSAMEAAIQALPAQNYAVPDADEFARIQAEVRSATPAKLPSINPDAVTDRPTLKRRN